MIYENDLIKVNGDFSSTEKAKEYAVNPVWQSYENLWEFTNAAQEDIGKVVYEHIANLVQNIRDIDVCGLHQLYSIAKELDVEQIFSYDLAYPVELEELLNTLSTNRYYNLTSGYILHNDTLDDIYQTLGTSGVYNQYYDTDGNITLSTDFDNMLPISSEIIYDDTYISGFMEPLIKKHLTENSVFLGEGNYNNIIVEDFYYKKSSEYQGFMDDIYYNPQSTWSSTTSAEIVDYCTHILRNICIRASYQRETLKTMAQKHAMIGSTDAVEKLISEYILRSFTKKESWRLYVEPSGSMKPQKLNDAYEMEQHLPTISNIANPNFDVRVVEYWDKTEYMNISAESPMVCGIIGYSNVSSITSSIDISGNLVTGSITAWLPDYGQGLCGHLITGGNNRYWENENLTDAIMLSETNSGEVSAFYNNVGISGDFEQMWSTQTNLWNIHATSGMDRMAVIPDLTGTPIDEYINTDVNDIPNSGWLIAPTSLSNIHRKYIGTLTGDVTPANIKNQQYPTIAPQPFIWNLIEKLYEDFPNMYQTLLYTDQANNDRLIEQVDISGNIIDSWKFFNQEFIGYNTQYEQANNLDFNDKLNPAIERDGPFDVDALSAYIHFNSNNLTPISEYISGYYGHIEKNFNLDTSQSPNITNQLEYFNDDIFNLSGKHIFQYSYDQLDNHYMLYKNDDKFESYGQLWMRYRNHPLPFPLSNDDETYKNTQQLYMWGGTYSTEKVSETSTSLTRSAISFESVINSKCYDFGFVGDIMWVFGQAKKRLEVVDKITNEIIYGEWMGYDDMLLVFTNDYQYFSVEEDYHYAYKQNTFENLSISKETFIGVYNYMDYIVFVYLDSFINNTATFKFKHYDKYKKRFIPHTRETVVIPNLPPIYTGTTDNIWKITSSESLVTIGYESLNSSNTSEYVNSITTIDLVKNTLSDKYGEYVTHEWKYIMDNF